MQIIRATKTAEQAGAYYVRIQAMARKHQITLYAEFDEHDTPETKYIVVVDDYLPVATCRLYAIDDERIMLGRIVVLPEYRHQGLGTLVVQEAEKWANELGFTTAVVESRENKTHFYETMGYVADYQFYDTLTASRRQFGHSLHNYQLHTVAAACGYDLENHHHALSDAEACAAIALYLL